MAMTQNSVKPNTKRIAATWFVIAVCVLAVSLFSILALRPSSTPYNPIDIPLSLTTSLMKAASDPQSVDSPSSLSSDVQAASGECWNVLKTAMNRNKNKYQLEARLLPDNGPTGADQVLVDVVFTDGTKVEMYYYNAFLSSCR